MSLFIRFLKRLLLLLLGIAIAWFSYLYIYGNFHKVDNQFYRSAQMFSYNMPHYMQKYHIKSILNLRGPAADKSWYRFEKTYAQKHGIVHIDFGIPDRAVISLETMQSLVDTIRKAPKPLLIHCKAGADRTSLVTALYLHAIKQDPHADDAISLLYGHFPWLGSKTEAMDRSFKAYIQHFPLKDNHPL